MRCFPIAALCLLLFASLSHADTPGSLPVTVRDRNGTPLVGVRLTLQPSARAVMTDRRGQATFTGVPPGSYTVSLAPPGYQPLSLPVTLTADAKSSMGFVLEKNGAASVATHSVAGTDYRVIVPGVPRLAQMPPPEYLLTPPVPPGSGPAWRAAQEVTLREAMFRYLFIAFPFSAARHYRVVYLSLAYFPWGQGTDGMKDPDAAFLKRFDGNVPPVQPVSALPTSSKDWDNQAKHHWIIYRVSSFKWTDDAHVEIDCGSAMSGFVSSDSVFMKLTLRNGWWQITGGTEVSA